MQFLFGVFLHFYPGVDTGVHDHIIDRATWEKVKAMRGTRKRASRLTYEKSIFSGFLKCSDCGSNLNYHFNHNNHGI